MNIYVLTVIVLKPILKHGDAGLSPGSKSGTISGSGLEGIFFISTSRVINSSKVLFILP